MSRDGRFIRPPLEKKYVLVCAKHADEKCNHSPYPGGIALPFSHVWPNAQTNHCLTEQTSSPLFSNDRRERKERGDGSRISPWSVAHREPTHTLLQRSTCIRPIRTYLQAIERVYFFRSVLRLSNLSAIYKSFKYPCTKTYFPNCTLHPIVT